jgi:hypothetical protein
MFYNEGAKGTYGEYGFYHLAIFQCPHQWDVVAYLKPKNPEVIKMLKSAVSNDSITYTIIPEFLMRPFVNGQIKSFDSDFMSGFLDKVSLLMRCFSRCIFVLFILQSCTYKIGRGTAATEKCLNKF